MCISLKNDQQEVAVVSLKGIGSNYEARMGIDYHKLSFKMDAASIEALNLDRDLVSILKVAEEQNPRGKENSFYFF